MRPTERLREARAVVLDDWYANRLDRIVGPTRERILFVHRRHWLVLVGPTLLALAMAGVLVAGEAPRLWLAGAGAGMTWLARRRRHWSDPKTVVVVALWVAPLWLTLDAPTSLVRVAGIYVFALYLLATVVRWWCEALVLTETSLWIISGVITTASPRSPLSHILFQDVRQNVLEELLHAGTLSFDTAGASDDPLSRFGPVDDPFRVSADIHQQRLLALRRSFPSPREGPSD
jgi:hypothetical protein